MPKEGLYADISLPVPLDRLFTYEIPSELWPAVSLGSRVWLPFGKRKFIGVVLRLHGEAPPLETRQILRLVDAEPVLDEELLQLGRWIAEYYCTPLGEVLKSMLPLGGELRRSTLYSLTEKGSEVARQLTFDPALAPILRLLEERPRSAAYLAKKAEGARSVLRELIKNGWIVAEETQGRRARRSIKLSPEAPSG